MKKFFFIILTLSCIQVFGEYKYFLLQKKLDVTTLFSEGALERAHQLMDSVATHAEYNIAISINADINTKDKLEQEDLDEMNGDAYKEASRKFKKFKVEKSRAKQKSILVHLQFNYHCPPLVVDNWKKLFFQHVAYGKKVSNYSRMLISNHAFENKPDFPVSDKTVNDAYLLELINYIISVSQLDEEGIEYPIGPIKVRGEVKKGKSSKSYGSIKYYSYTFSKATFSIDFSETGFDSLRYLLEQVEFSENDFTFFMDEKSNDIKEAIIKFVPDREDSRYNKDLRFLKVRLREMSLSIDTEANLTGNVTFGANTTEDVNLGSVVKLKKGVNGSLGFTFNGGKTFEGAFDFSGVQGIKFQMMKQGKVLAELTNAQYNEGFFAGKLVLKQNVSFATGSAQASLDALDMNLRYSFKRGLKVDDAKGILKIDEIKGVNGFLKFDFNYNSSTGMRSNLSQERRSEIQVAGMLLSDLKLESVLDTNWNLTSLTGTLKGKHESFDGMFNVSNFEIKNGELIKFEGSGKVAYKGLNFNLKDCRLRKEILSITADAEMKFSGAEAKFAVSKFDMALANDSIAIGSINGNLNHSFAKVRFNASYKQPKFKGNFNADLSFIKLNGTLDLGEQTTNNPNYSYGHFILGVGGAGVPLGPLPLKLTKLGGELGYNYTVTPIDEEDISKGFRGSPEHNTYLAGLELGVADVSNTVNLEAYTRVVLANDYWDLFVKGLISVPQRNAVFKGSLQMNWRMHEDESKDYMLGQVTTDFKIPENSGAVFKTNRLGVDFSIRESGWNVKRTNITADILRDINFKGEVDLSGDFNPGSHMQGFINGSLQYTYNETFEFQASFMDFELVDANATIGLSFDSQANLNFKDGAVSGDADVNLSGMGSYDISLLNEFYTTNGTASGYCMGTATFLDNKMTLRGQASITFINSDNEEEVYEQPIYHEVKLN